MDGKQFHLGCYKTEDEAHQAYCEAAELVHREFSCLASSQSRRGRAKGLEHTPH